MIGKIIKVIGAIFVGIIALIIYMKIDHARYIKSPTVQLARAIRNNDIEKAKKEITRGANVNATSGKGTERMLGKAIREGNWEMVLLLLNNGADPLLNQPYSRKTSLDESIYRALYLGDQNQKRIIPLLMGPSSHTGINLYAGIDSGTGRHFPKIIAAILMENVALVEQLLKNNSEINFNDSQHTGNISHAADFAANKEINHLLREYRAIKQQ